MREAEGEGERECKQCHSVQEAMLQSTLPRHESTSPATKRLRVSAEKFSSSPPRVTPAETLVYIGKLLIPLRSYLPFMPPPF